MLTTYARTYTDINDKALTFINRESYLKRIYLSTDNTSSAEKDIIKSIFHESILINIRTYDSHSLVLYANDQFNNFIHLYITNSNEVVYLFNYGDEIVNLTIVHSELNSGKSIQIAVIRTEDTSTMFVNDRNVTVPKGYKLMDGYTNKPWMNPEKGKQCVTMCGIGANFIAQHTHLPSSCVCTAPHRIHSVGRALKK